MARILFLPYSEQLGSTYPLIDLAKHFVDKGDEVIFAGSGTFMKLVKANHYKTYPLIEVPYAIYDASLKKATGGFHTYKTAKEHIEQELALFDKVKPDLVIAQNRPTVKISTQIRNIKYISVIVSLATKWRGTSFHKADLFSYAALFKIPVLGKILDRHAEEIIEYVSKSWLGVYNKVCKEYGIPKFESFFDLVEGNFMTLIPESQNLFPLKKGFPKDKYFYIGPQLNSPHFEEPHWYNDVKDKDGIFIYLSMGSTAHKLYPNVYKRLVEIFGNRKEVTIITNTSWIMDGEKEHAESPDNVNVTNIAPAEIMFKLADVTICHGGNGTIYHSLCNGVPVFAISERAEHEINMKRLKELRLGDYVLFKDFEKISNEKFEELIMKVVKDKKMRENVQKYGALINEEMANVGNIVDLIRSKI